MSDQPASKPLSNTCQQASMPPILRIHDDRQEPVAHDNSPQSEENDQAQHVANPKVYVIDEEPVDRHPRSRRNKGLRITRNTSDERILTVRISLEILDSAGIDKTACERGMVFPNKGGGICIFLGASATCPITGARTSLVRKGSRSWTFTKTVSSAKVANILGEELFRTAAPKNVMPIEQGGNRFLFCRFGPEGVGTTVAADVVPVDARNVSIES